MLGDGRIEGQNYAISAWVRDDTLSISLAPPRTKSNKYPPEAFRGSLEPGEHYGSGDDAPTWAGTIAGDEGSFEVRAFEKTGKSGTYLTLELARSA